MSSIPNGFTRRGFLRLAGGLGMAMVGASCSPATTGAPAPDTSTAPKEGIAEWEIEWEKTLSAAKEEGRVAIVGHATGAYKGAVEAFEDAFPGIKAELSIFSGGAVVLPRILQEQAAGVYTWDLCFFEVIEGWDTLRPAGAVEPVRPLIMHPDALDDKGWRGGFESGWADPEKRYAYSTNEDITGNFWINTDLVKPEEVQTVHDLLKPKFKGKIIFAPPARGGVRLTMTAVRLQYGEELVKKLIIDQKVFIQRDDRLIVDAMVRGDYLVSTSLSVQILDEYRAQGLGRNLKKMIVEGTESLTVYSPVWLLKRAPHPNAAKVFVNWYLSKPGQEAYATTSRRNSRRLDVAPGDSESLPKSGTQYRWLAGNREMDREIEKTVELVTSITR